MIITIDGPAGSGKSTLAMMLAQHLNMFCLNSGYLYRGMAYVLTNFYGYDEIMLTNPDAQIMQSCIDSGDFRYVYEQDIEKLYYKDVDITPFLKQIEVSKYTPILAQSAQARKIIRGYKRTLAKQYKDLVAEGRVLGSVVFPDAEVKFYLIASEQVRAQRIQKYQAQKGNAQSLEEVLVQVSSRDQVDMNRKVDPLVQPEDAIVLDTSDLSKEQMLQEALKHIG